MPLKFAYTIIYVPNVTTSIEFFEKAFGLQRRFIADGNDYGELETGGTALAFAAHSLGHDNLPAGYIAASDSLKPLGVEIALVSDDVAASHAQAVASGATSLKEPVQKPWGQTVSYVRCPDGTLVELCSPMAG
jgi:lactoylglutathione lyase